MNTDFPKNKLLHGIFEEQAARTPGAKALFFNNLSITYSELNSRSNSLAYKLIENGVGRGSIVGIMAERSLEMVTGLLAILKSGAAYLPIPPENPIQRNRHMVQDSCAVILLAQEKFAARANETAGTSAGVLLLPIEDNFSHEAANPAIACSPGDPAYVIYTSGSTGNPKGVVIEHRSIMNRLHWMQETYPLKPGDKILQKTPYFFDVSVWELFLWFFGGAALCLLQPGFEKFPRAIVDTVQKQKITVMHFVPSMLSVFLGYLERPEDIGALSSLRRVFSSGEELKTSHLKLFNRILNQANGTELTNFYGPTEATVDVSFFDCPIGNEPDKIPIGKAIQNIGLHIFDPQGGSLPPGDTGELVISGVGVARGYLNRPELTADRFITIDSKNGNLPGEYCYRSGDLARCDQDGNFIYLGRIDNQVKIRGIRIELGEIEAVISSISTVKDCAVVVKETSETLVNLCAFLISSGELDVEELKVFLKKRLPQYMVPTEYIQLETLPLTPSGKVDRKKLSLSIDS